MKPIKNKALTAAAVGSTALAITMLGLPSQAATSSSSSHAHASTLREGGVSGVTPSFYDARNLTGRSLALAERGIVGGRTKSERSYLRSLGTQADVRIDPLTRTPSNFTRLNGFLTGRSSAPARSVAMNYVRSHLSDLGLVKADVGTFRFRHDYVDTIGVHHLYWGQAVKGTQVFGNGLKVNVTRLGQVVSVQGSPVSGLGRLASRASASARLTPAAARTAAARNVRSTADRSASVTTSRTGPSARTTWSNNDFAQKVWFLTPTGLRLGWSTYVQTGSGAGYQHVIDAATGRVLYRASLTRNDAGDALVYDNYPGAAHGGRAKVVNFFKRGWLRRGATFLNGNSVVAFSDVNDDDAMQNSEKTPVPGTKHHAQFPLKKYGTAASSFCSRFVCTWNPHVVGSWKVNRKEVTTNGFYFASNFHDYLARKPIGFTPAAGNFTAAGGDPVLLNTLDGANTDHGMPDFNHIDNANMTTPPDGLPPKMQMYLFHAAGATDAEDPFVPTTGSLDASVQYHEYTHGLSSRLVTDANGNEALDQIEAGSMGEAWSDYYAMDYLVQNGFFKDTSKPGELLEGKYVAAGLHSIRTMAIDCPVGATTKGCTSGFDGRKGGYTYADFASVIDGPEVHASGEIWGQTLWDIRSKFGHDVADTLITRAMSLSPAQPSFLDMRNAILQADMIKYGSSHTTALWKIFAHRGMGYFAAAVDGGDAAPAADFHVPPAPVTPRTSFSGVVSDPTTGNPVNGAVVHIAGQSDTFDAVSHDGGRYTISGIFPGTYPKVVASAPGYFQDVESVDTNSSAPADFSIPRDWAATSGGGQVVDFNGADFTPFGCGPDQAVDTTSANGWLTSAGDDNADLTGTFIPKQITVKLPNPVDITTFGVDPGGACGIGGSASTAGFKIETSPDANPADFVEAASSTTFRPFTGSDDGHLTAVPLNPGTGTGVQYVRFTIESNRVPAPYSTNCPDGPYFGCQYATLSELAVFGTAAP